jgi:hypothetical protein
VVRHPSQERGGVARRQIHGYLAKQKDLFDQKFTERVKLTSGDDLAPGVLKMVRCTWR